MFLVLFLIISPLIFIYGSQIVYAHRIYVDGKVEDWGEWVYIDPINDGVLGNEVGGEKSYPMDFIEIRFTGNAYNLFGLIIVHNLSNIVPGKTNPAPWYTINIDDPRLGDSEGCDKLAVKFLSDESVAVDKEILWDIQITINLAGKFEEVDKGLYNAIAIGEGPNDAFQIVTCRGGETKWVSDRKSYVYVNMTYEDGGIIEFKVRWKTMDITPPKNKDIFRVTFVTSMYDVKKEGIPDINRGADIVDTIASWDDEFSDDLIINRYVIFRFDNDSEPIPFPVPIPEGTYLISSAVIVSIAS